MTTVDPKATDRALARIYAALDSVHNNIAHAADEIRRAVGASHNYRTGTWDKFSIVTDAIAAGPPRDDEYAARVWAEKVATFERLRARANSLRAEAAPLHALFDAHRWSRFFLVTSSIGHIHRSTHCPSCYPTTRYGWLPDLSGESEAAAVAAHGARLCTVCFPTAPVEYTNYFDEAAKSKVAGRCPGSGLEPDGPVNYRHGIATGKCAVCGFGNYVNGNCRVRAHKPPPPPKPKSVYDLRDERPGCYSLKRTKWAALIELYNDPASNGTGRYDLTVRCITHGTEIHVGNAFEVAEKAYKKPAEKWCAGCAADKKVENGEGGLTA